MDTRNTPNSTTAQLLNFARDYDGDLILTLRVFDDGALDLPPRGLGFELDGLVSMTPELDGRLVDELLPTDYSSLGPAERAAARDAARDAAGRGR